MKNKENKFVNIPEHKFIPNDAVSEIRKNVTVRQNKEALFEVNEFVAIQFIEGIKSEEMLTKVVDTPPLDVVLKLTSVFYQCDEDRYHFTRSDVITLKAFLEARMEHCEKERDERTLNNEGMEVFNPDTYIAMKLLLLDIREWLIGEIIEYKEDNTYDGQDEAEEAEPTPEDSINYDD